MKHIIDFISDFLILKASQFVFYATLITTTVFNVNLYEFIFAKVDVSTLFGFSTLVSVFLVVFLVTYIFNSLLALISPLVLKAFLIITSLINASAIYYMDSFNVVLDRSMMGNIINTRFSEAIELLSVNFLAYMVLVGLVPAWFIYKVHITEVNRIRTALNMLAVIIVSVFFIYLGSSNWLWIDKYAKVIGGKIVPWSYIFNTARYVSSNNHSTKDQKKLPDGQFGDTDKTVLVLVIGETARSANFSLYGYEKETNPKLKQVKNLVVLKNTTSCTTYTTGSLACMLSANEDTKQYEALPTYLTRHGANVIWRSNNWGEPPITVSEYAYHSDLRKDCQGDGCHLDEALLTNLKQTIEMTEEKKILIVLHTKGSHGPSYYTRYTKPFEQFMPVCSTEVINQCAKDELVNAYDNTILYTDHFLTELIDTLSQLDNTPSAMMYISDHGESLGEGGLYLHGTPYLISPDYQKDIPFLMWVSDQLQTQKGIDIHRLNQADSHSQYNVFHTVLGILNFHSLVYNPQLDILNDAQTQPTIKDK